MSDPNRNRLKRSQPVLNSRSSETQLSAMKAQLLKLNDKLKMQTQQFDQLTFKCRRDGIRSQKIKKQTTDIQDKYNLLMRNQADFFMNAYKNTGSPLFENENGLSPFQLLKLQITRFQEEEPTICMVCYSDLQVGSTIFRLPCKHIVHRQCGVQSLLYSKFCPACNIQLK